LNGSTLIKISGGTSPTSDLVDAYTRINLGGTLLVTNVGANLIESGNSFTLFETATFSGKFAATNLPTLWPGLSWNTTALNSSGVISVTDTVIPPKITNSAVIGGNFVIKGSGGLAGATFNVISSTNVAAPLVNWTIVSTNVFVSDGSFNITNAINPAEMQHYYLLILQQ
jgi:hypothetical protein